MAPLVPWSLCHPSSSELVPPFISPGASLPLMPWSSSEGYRILCRGHWQGGWEPGRVVGRCGHTRAPVRAYLEQSLMQSHLGCPTAAALTSQDGCMGLEMEFWLGDCGIRSQVLELALGSGFCLPPAPPAGPASCSALITVTSCYCPSAPTPN